MLLPEILHLENEEMCYCISSPHVGRQQEILSHLIYLAAESLHDGIFS